ncbi:uncharacterized protein LOC130567659 isoform X2 [Triplophysa rosa]|nr:uncharacterized protein LOC130567659 isoform X2 [Triplophysa rosa]XP_057211910.1 uncharacterized protein LOC130567659 isoform X2 [Triplophysa rosa]
MTDGRSDSEEEISYPCNIDTPPHCCMMDGRSDNEEEISDPCNISTSPQHIMDDESASETETWDQHNTNDTATDHYMDEESDSEHYELQNCHMTPPLDPTMDAAAGGDAQDDSGENPKSVKEKIYPSAKISHEESLLSILCYALRHTTTKSALSDLLDLINLHCPEGTNGVPSSLYKFLKTFDCNSFEIMCICPKCHHYLGNEVPDCCASCGSELGDMNSLVKSGNIFLKVSIRKQLEEKMLDTTFRAALDYKWTRGKSSPDSVQDIFDGAMYKSVDPLNDPDQFNLSLTWNIDGIHIFKSSPFHIWPIQIIINELPPHMRSRHVLLAGLWFGASKPKMNDFMQPFVDECLLLEQEGLTVVHKGQSLNIHVFNLVCVCDSVARCAVQNVKQFNGEHGCNWCYKKGEIVA